MPPVRPRFLKLPKHFPTQESGVQYCGWQPREKKLDYWVLSIMSIIQTSNPENILCNLNLDMLARSDDHHRHNKYLYCIGTDQSAELDSLVRKADNLFDKYSFDYALNNTKMLAGTFARSDQYSFCTGKVHSGSSPLLGLHKDYHQPTDTADKIDYENLENRVRQISLIIGLLQTTGVKNHHNP